jgi:phenylacetate-CoA ligase
MSSTDKRADSFWRQRFGSVDLADEPIGSYDDFEMARRNKMTRPTRSGKMASHRRARARVWRLQMGKFRAMLRSVLPANQFYRAKLRRFSFSPRSLSTPEQFRELPFTTKAELLEDQAQHPPYGTNLTYPVERYCRLHQSSGTAGAPLRWLDTVESWQWFLGCWDKIYDVIGLRQADRLFFPFTFGPFLGFWGAFEGASRRGNLCLPGGGMTSLARLRFMLENNATVVACTPTYALRLAEVAEEHGIDLAGSSVRAIVVAGEPGGSIATTRAKIESSWGVRVFDHTGMTEIGALGIECIPNPCGVHLIETDSIAESINPRTTKPAEPGEIGELVITNLGRWGSPVIRYRTGDLVQVDPNPCPCGRPWTRLAGGILGRVDDMVIIRGNNLHAAAVEELLRGLPEIGEFRCTIRSNRAMNSLTIEVEPAPSNDRNGVSIARSVSQAFHDRFHFRADVVAVPRGKLPRFEMKGQRFVRELTD